MNDRQSESVFQALVDDVHRLIDAHLAVHLLGEPEIVAVLHCVAQNAGALKDCEANRRKIRISLFSGLNV